MLSKPINIAIDLTPILPGGANGGAKLMTIQLIRDLAELAPDCRFTLLTSHQSHDELACLDAPNVRRVCVIRPNKDHYGRSLRSRVIRGLQRLATLCIPDALRLRLISGMDERVRSRTPFLRELDAGLLFCPFTAPFYCDLKIPTVAVVYDLQFIYYPQFFSADDLFRRSRHFQDACRKSTKVVCISEYVRKTVLENSNIEADRVVSIAINMPHRLQKPSSATVVETLDRLSLRRDGYLLYPANFWPHKNHQMLFTAFGLFLKLHPESDLRLVCTGAPGSDMEVLREAAGRMHLGGRIVLPGYVEEDAFAALLSHCLALIYPSLFEGFGMPLIEAMAHRKPVLCSSAACLPETAGDAALYFDPRKPFEIAAAIERITAEPKLVEDLKEKCGRRLAALADTMPMAENYLHIFECVLNERPVPA